MDASFVVIGGESIQLAMQVETVPEEGLIEIFAPKGSDKAVVRKIRSWLSEWPVAVTMVPYAYLLHDRDGIFSAALDHSIQRLGLLV